MHMLIILQRDRENNKICVDNEPHAEPETSAAAELPRKPEGLRFTPGADPVDMDFPAEVLEEVFSSGGPLLPEEDQPSETQIIHFPHQPVPEEDGKPAAETTATEASSGENAPVSNI